MKAGEKPKNHFIVLRPVTDTFHGTLEAVKKQNGQDNLLVTYVDTPEEANQLMRQYSPCIVGFSIERPDQVAPSINFVRMLSDKIDTNEIKVLAVNKVSNPGLTRALEKLKLSVVVTEPISQRTLMFKFLLQIRALDVVRKQIEIKAAQNERIAFDSSKKTDADTQAQGAILVANKPKANDDVFTIHQRKASERSDASPSPGANGPEGTVWQKKSTEQIFAPNGRSIAEGELEEKKVPDSKAKPADERSRADVSLSDDTPEQELEAVFTRQAASVAEETEKRLSSRERSTAAEKQVREAQAKGPLDGDTGENVEGGKLSGKPGAVEAKAGLGGDSKAQGEGAAPPKHKAGLRKLAELSEKLKSRVSANRPEQRGGQESASHEESEVAAADGSEVARESAERKARSRADGESAQLEAKDGLPRGGQGNLDSKEQAAEGDGTRGRPSFRNRTGSSHGAEKARSGAAEPQEKESGSEARAAKREHERQQHQQDARAALEKASPSERPRRGRDAKASDPLKKAREALARGSLAESSGRVPEEEDILSQLLAEAEAAELKHERASANQGPAARSHPANDTRETVEKEGRRDPARPEIEPSETPGANAQGGAAEALTEASEKRRSRIESEAKNKGEADGDFSFGESAPENTWSGINDVAKSRRDLGALKNRLGDLEEEKVKWQAKNEEDTPESTVTENIASDFRRLKAEISDEPGSWIQAGSCYLYLPLKIESGIGALAEALPLWLLEGASAKPRSEGKFWSFPDGSLRCVEAVEDLPDSVKKFLEKFLPSAMAKKGFAEESKARAKQEAVAAGSVSDGASASLGDGSVKREAEPGGSSGDVSVADPAASPVGEVHQESTADKGKGSLEEAIEAGAKKSSKAKEKKSPLDMLAALQARLKAGAASISEEEAGQELQKVAEDSLAVSEESSEPKGRSGSAEGIDQKDPEAARESDTGSSEPRPKKAKKSGVARDALSLLERLKSGKNRQGSTADEFEGLESGHGTVEKNEAASEVAAVAEDATFSEQSAPAAQAGEAQDDADQNEIKKRAAAKNAQEEGVEAPKLAASWPQAKDFTIAPEIKPPKDISLDQEIAQAKNREREREAAREALASAKRRLNEADPLPWHDDEEPSPLPGANGHPESETAADTNKAKSPGGAELPAPDPKPLAARELPASGKLDPAHSPAPGTAGAGTAATVLPFRAKAEAPPIAAEANLAETAYGLPKNSPKQPSQPDSPPIEEASGLEPHWPEGELPPLASFESAVSQIFSHPIPESSGPVGSRAEAIARGLSQVEAAVRPRSRGEDLARRLAMLDASKDMAKVAKALHLAAQHIQTSLPRLKVVVVLARPDGSLQTVPEGRALGTLAPVLRDTHRYWTTFTTAPRKARLGLVVRPEDPAAVLSPAELSSLRRLFKMSHEMLAAA